MKKILATALVCFALALPSASHAQALSQGQAFGGLIATMIACTCSGNFWYMFAPLYIGPAEFGGALVAQGETDYPYYFLHPGAWALGFYEQGGQCQIYVGTGCVSLPSLGMISPETGVSL